jgi:ADP-L-glycero-D-manno-heptose 6-epimerase
MYIVTGGAGFIGSNLVHELNAHGITDILIVDNFANARKFQNLHGARYVDYLDKRDFRRAIKENSLGINKIEAILHQGACSNTLEDDGVYMLDNNFTYTKEVLEFALLKAAPLVFASTAAVYGLSGPGRFTLTIENERPLNIYGYSKLVFDHYFRNQHTLDQIPSTVVGLRYFNVYGPREAHKGPASSMILQLAQQIRRGQAPRIFKHGEHIRDFVYVKDIVNCTILAARARKSGIYNAGSGVPRSFNDIVANLNRVLNTQWQPEYIDNPHAHYQPHTEADLSATTAALRYTPKFTLEAGIDDYFASGFLV